MSVPVQTSLAGLLAQAEHRVTRRIECALRAADISSEQWRVLSLLADGTGHPMSEIANFALVPAPTLTKIIDRLIDRTLVYRRVDSEDRRRVLVFLSSRGTDLYRMLGIDVALAEQELAETLGGQDTAQLAELLARLVDRLA
ncbi:MAG TPA: MarR family transcriptional regulator [Pseudonocardia sp.]|nr:MarR family transcriptional regulator [Pseudonocardia sp.]